MISFLFGKLSSGHRTGKISFHSNPKETQTTTQLHSSHMLATEKAMAPHSSALAWKIPWMEEPGGLQSMGSPRVGHNWATSLSRTEGGNGNPLECSCLENPRDGRAWWAAVYGVAQSRTRLSHWTELITKVCVFLWEVIDLRKSWSLRNLVKPWPACGILLFTPI